MATTLSMHSVAQNNMVVSLCPFKTARPPAAVRQGSTSKSDNYAFSPSCISRIQAERQKQEAMVGEEGGGVVMGET